MIDTKALREKVLDLAIRGKLVPQDPNDEPATVLLERIREQKKQMVKEGKLKAKDIKNDTIIFKGDDNLHYEQFADGTVKCIEDEIPFDVPDGWAWSRFKSFCYPISDGTHQTPTYTKEGYTFLSAKNVTSWKIDWENVMYIPEELHIALSKRIKPQKGDILLAKNGTIGVAAIVDKEFDFDIYVTLALIRTVNDSISSHYLLNTIASSTVQSAFRNSLIGIGVQNLHLEHIREVLIPIAPHNEQVRITDKVLSLLPLLEIIETNKADLYSLMETTKSKILDLAIQGKLVPQDPNDEPASVLLERIRAEKEELIKAGKIKRDKKESVIFKGDDNSYYLKTGDITEPLEDWELDGLPDSWSFCCLGEICDYGNCVNVATVDIDDSAWILDLEDIEKDTGIVLQKVRKAKRNSISTKHLFHKGQVLYSKLRPYLNKVVLADEDGYCTSEILPLEFQENIIPQYARYYLMSPTFLQYTNKCSYGVKMPRLGTVDGKKAIITIPPLAEQKRIVETIEIAFAHLDEIASSIS